jgi:hypothetical protein
MTRKSRYYDTEAKSGIEQRLESTDFFCTWQVNEGFRFTTTKLTHLTLLGGVLKLPEQFKDEPKITVIGKNETSNHTTQ